MKTADEVGGDYYDFYKFNNSSKYWFSIGDVSGHGVNAGLIMLMTQSMISSILNKNPELSPKELMDTINYPLYQNVVSRLKSGLYVVLTVGCFDVEGNFEVIGTQIPPIIYRSNTNKCEILELEGQLIGIMPDISHYTKQSSFKLNPGDIAIFVSDGTWEITNEHIEKSLYKSELEWRTACMFGLDRLKDILILNSNRSASIIMEAILKSVLQWGPVKDDITITIFKKLKEQQKVIKMELS